jgi:hypothetical protein
MRHKLATYALLRLHAEIAGKMVKNRSEAKRLRRHLDHVDAVIRMLEPSINIHTAAVQKRKPNPWFKHGTIFRLTVETLRTAQRPLSSREITLMLLQRRGVTDASPQAVRDLVCSIERSLVYHRGRSIEAVGSRPVHWKLTD